MTYRLDGAGQRRLDRYFDKIGSVLRRRDRRESFALYAIGLFRDAERKSIEPIAAMACGEEELCRAYPDQLSYFFFVMIRRPPRSPLFPSTNALPILFSVAANDS